MEREVDERSREGVGGERIWTKRETFGRNEMDLERAGRTNR